MQVEREILKIVQLRAHIPVDANAIRGFLLSKTCLQRAKQTTGTRDSETHAAEFAQDLVPFAGGDALASVQAFKNGEQTFATMLGQTDGLREGVD